MSNMYDIKTHTEKQTGSEKDPMQKIAIIEPTAPSSAPSQILIQKDLPLHKLNAPESAPEPALAPNPKEKWSSLKSNLQSAVDTWTELEKITPTKSPEEEQLDKMRSLISNLKERLAEF